MRVSRREARLDATVGDHDRSCARRLRARVLITAAQELNAAYGVKNEKVRGELFLCRSQ